MTLFKDADYGQWGLRIMSPDKSAARTAYEPQWRPSEVEPGDIALGEFLGDSDLLIVTRTGAALVALPLDPRKDWYRVGDTIDEFLAHYIDTNGDTCANCRDSGCGDAVGLYRPTR